MISKVLVLGGGSAGFLSAITLKIKLPDLDVVLVRSPGIGIIGVGEGTTFTVPNFLHGYLGIDPKQFHQAVNPTYKLGIRFLWGERPFFHYTFTNQLNARYSQLPKPNGYYCDEDFQFADVNAALMAQNKVFERQEDGGPLVNSDVAYHVENKQFVAFLEQVAREAGISIVDDTVEEVSQDDEGVSALKMESGETMTSDLYVDCSGFRSQLLHRTLGEPFISFESSLFCDRAVVGGWPRSDEPLKPYTTAETMNSGWCWQIEHEHFINRGYVYSSRHISDDDAEQEFREKNPKVDKTRVVKFISGRYRNAWVKNVVAIGNASGFVEPLEATAIAVICEHAAALVKTIADSDRRIKPSQVRCFNRENANNWDSIRRFLALHYKFNNRLDTPFWRDCRETTDLYGAEEMVEHFQENGPSVLWTRHVLQPNDPFGWEGYLAMLVGQQVPYEKTYTPSESESEQWNAVKAELKQRADAAVPQEEALAMIRSDNWSWRPDFYASASKW